MKSKNRKEFRISKTLPSGHVESCRIVVMKSDYNTAKKNYENMGYKVS